MQEKAGIDDESVRFIRNIGALVAARSKLNSFFARSDANRTKRTKYPIYVMLRTHMRTLSRYFGLVTYS